MNRTVDFLKYFIPFSIVLFATQYFIMQSLSEKLVFFYSAWSIYIFNILATFLVYLFLIFVNKNFPTYTGFAFLGASFFRMMLAIIFLIPLIKAHVKDPIIDLGTFFIPYFLFLLFETYFTVRLINKS
ncbi:membrane protein [Flavobacterium sp. KMS]|nr:membrane protein [Flavobacterium sp. KMS]